MLLFVVSTIPIQQLKHIIKQHVHGLEAMYSFINSVTTGKAMIKGHVNTQFVKKYIQRLMFVISI